MCYLESIAQNNMMQQSLYNQIELQNRFINVQPLILPPLPAPVEPYISNYEQEPLKIIPRYHVYIDPRDNPLSYSYEPPVERPFYM